MAQDDKVAPEEGWRQGQSGQAGRQVARLLGSVLDPAARRRGFAEASLLTDWATIVGPGLARRCQPVRVDYAPGRRTGGTLLVHAGSAAAVELQHATPQIVERINNYFGFNAIRQLRLLQVPLKPAPPPRMAPPLRPLQPEEEAALRTALDGIGDEDLREALLMLGRALRGTRP
ncbi:DUF721 domain-containing protein [Benzoatithermus flavus]|uniref:DciA family protein n=1 Tax=Benzoatithermus flavus TaxID=3108223 RepID=A0ABU8XLV0_9PROT